MYIQSEKTIAAVSTPPGESGIAVIRMSGDRALPILQSVFQADPENQILKNRKAIHGWILDGSTRLDEVVVTYFQNPNSYTGEDVVEINCHGSPFICHRILAALFSKGARPANPGEFTLRAFLNKKMDLTQAEAVADLIHSKTEASRKAAMVQLEGRLSKWIYSIRDRLIHVCVLLEVELDFSEEDIQFASRRDIEILIDEMILDTRKLVASFDRGRVCREGLRIALIGKPNVGKSSLLNRLLEKERAIVTEIPGTTRDTVEDILDIGGMMCHITDTAGIRDTSDPIEIEGVRRANRALESADLVLLVLDKSMVMDKEDEALIVRTLDLKKNAFCIVNKIDAMPAWQIDTLKPLIEKMQLYEVSALKDTGIPLLVSAIETAVRFESPPDIGDIFLTNIRHRDCLLKLGKNLQEAASSIKKGMSQEFIVVDLMGALETVGEITGDSAGDDVLNRIFSSLCIGK